MRLDRLSMGVLLLTSHPDGVEFHRFYPTRPACKGLPVITERVCGQKGGGRSVLHAILILGDALGAPGCR
jgi:hypothetical protein